MITGNPAFCFALYLTGIHFRGELQHFGGVSEQKFKCRPIRTREAGGARLSETLYVNRYFFLLSIFITVFFPMPKYEETMSHPDEPCAARMFGMILI